MLGLFEEWDCSIEERRLYSGDMLALYTDGITESFNEAGDEFGEERLVEALRRRRDLPQRACSIRSWTMFVGSAPTSSTTTSR